MSFCKRRCKGTAIFSNHQIIPYYIIYFFVGLHFSSNIFSKTVLSSEAGCPIIVIIRRTRFAQTASHVDLLSLLCNSRIEEDSDNSTSSKDLLVRNVFREYNRGNMEHRAVIGFAACYQRDARMFSRIYSRKPIWLFLQNRNNDDVACRKGRQIGRGLLRE